VTNKGGKTPGIDIIVLIDKQDKAELLYLLNRPKDYKASPVKSINPTGIL